jgi:hypothetical protein
MFPQPAAENLCHAAGTNPRRFLHGAEEPWVQRRTVSAQRRDSCEFQRGKTSYEVCTPLENKQLCEDTNLHHLGRWKHLVRGVTHRPQLCCW